MTSAFDEDTRVESEGGGVYRATVTERWSIGAAPNGGYLQSLVLRALAEEVVHPDPLTSTAHFLRPCVPGPVTVETEVLRAGRSVTNASARLVQDGRVAVVVLATFGDLDANDGPSHVTLEPPALPPVEACLATPPDVPVPEVVRRFDFRLDPATVGGIVGAPTGEAVIRGWVRFADGREPDVASLPLFSDAFAPAVLNVVSASWVPTIEFTVHVRGRPARGWLRAEFRTRALAGGELEEDGEIWDADDRLVAMSRQLARVRIGTGAVATGPG